MIATWPSDLPPPMRNGHQEQRQDARLRRAADTGPPTYRRRFSSVSADRAMIFDLTRAEKAVFDAFYIETVAEGSLPFYMPDYKRDGWALLAIDGTPLLDSTGAQVTQTARILCLFGSETPQETQRGLRFQIGFSVAVMP